MSQTHDTGCIHVSDEKILTKVRHVDVGALPPTPPLP